MTTAQTISRIDQEIDAIRKDLCGRKRVKPLSAASWQAAWDSHPELRNRENELFRQRGVAQQERDEKAVKAVKAVKVTRIKRAKKCPTCGCRTLAAA